MEKIITSAQNPLIKEVKSLKSRKYREDKDLFFIEGIRLVEEAMTSGAIIVRTFMSEQYVSDRAGKELNLDGRQSGETYVLPDRLFCEIADTESPQGILAVVRAEKYKFDDIISKHEKLIIILDAVQDPGNLGTIIRTADAAGATGIILSRGCVDVYNPKVLRSTMGSVFHVPFVVSGSLQDDIMRLKREGVKVYAAHLKGRPSFYDVSMTGDIAVIIGNEANGISDETASAADVLVKIPMPGRAESLNASVAAGLLIYEAVRQREIL
jgi:TrmH family RNA methyltransferase